MEGELTKGYNSHKKKRKENIALMIKEYQRITNVDPAPTRRNSFDFIFGSEDTSDYDSIIVCGIVNSRLFPVSLLLK